MNDLGEKIRIMRKSRDLSQAELAEKAGLSTSAIAMYETGKRKPKYEQLEALADVFNVPLSAFLDENPEDIKRRLTEKKEWDVEYPAGVALSRRKEPVRPSVSLTDGDIAAIAKYLKQQTEKAPVTPEARIVSFGMDQLPQQDRDTILNMIRAMFSKRPEAKYFADEEDTSSDT